MLKDGIIHGYRALRCDRVDIAQYMEPPQTGSDFSLDCMGHDSRCLCDCYQTGIGHHKVHICAQCGQLIDFMCEHKVGICAASGIDPMRNEQDILFLPAARAFGRRLATRQMPDSALQGHTICFGGDSSRSKEHSWGVYCPQAAL